IRAPVIKDLQSPQGYVWFLNIDPVVFYQLLAGQICVLDFDTVNQQAYGNEVAINQTLADFIYVFGRVRLERAHEFFHRHRRKKVVARKAASLVVQTVPRFNRADPIRRGVYSVDSLVGNYLTTKFDDLPGGVLPPLPRTILGIDRKSTRLNSSHMSISYAVFCLKKK